MVLFSFLIACVINDHLDEQVLLILYMCVRVTCVCKALHWSLCDISSDKKKEKKTIIMQKPDTVINENIVIVGAGIAGLATALGLHRLNIRSLVLESSDRLRSTGFALGIWTNAWKALDALDVGDQLREKSLQIRGFKILSPNSGQDPDAEMKFEKGETRCLRRKDLLETLEKELPNGTIRYSSKIVSIEESGNFKLLQLADGSLVKTKALIGCDGVNSVVAKWLGLGTPVSAGRSAIRSLVELEEGHGFDPKLHLYLGGGVRYGFIPIDEKTLYWFCTFPPTLYKYDENDQDPARMKQFVLSNIQNAPKPLKQIVERTKLDLIICSPLKLRLPWSILLGNITKNNVCVAGDAFHPMTPDIGQGGCSALEDSVVLARSIARGLSENSQCYVKGMEIYARERRLRSFGLVSVAYVVGFVQESKGVVMSFLRRMFLSRFTVRVVGRMGDFDCGNLNE